MMTPRMRESTKVNSASPSQADRRDRKVVAAVKALTGTKPEEVLYDGITIEWKSLAFTVEAPKAKKWFCFDDEEEVYKKKVMMNVSGKVSPGQFLAVMGPEASGKSLLIRILSGRLNDPESISGSVTYNGLPFSENIRKRIGFVEQVSFFQENLTVKETLLYSAMLKLPQNMESIDRLVRVEHVLDSLELTQCANTIVGQVGGALTNERRRLSIGVEMITDPPLLLLDEPTSGLDGAMALRIIRTLAAYVAAGRTVITTMKQPSNRVFDHFSLLLLLAEGNPIYFGPSSFAMSYFEELGHRPTYDCSPAEYFLDLAVSEPSDASIHYGTTLNLIREWRRKSEPNPPDAQNNIENGPKESCVANPAEFTSTTEDNIQPSSSTWFHQFKVLTMRNAKAYHTINSGTLSWMLSIILFALLIGCVWYKRKRSTDGIRDQAGLVFFAVIFWSLVPTYATLITFLQDRHLLRLEQEAAMYHASAYYASRVLLYLPYEVFLPIVFSSIVYGMTIVNGSLGNFILFSLTLILNCMIGSSVGLVIGSIASTVRNAVYLATLIQLFFFVIIDFLCLNAPHWIAWTKYISYSTFVHHILMRIVFPSDVDYDCSSNGDGSVSCPILQHPEVDGRLDTINGSRYLEVIVLLCMLFIYRLLALAFLRMGVSAKHHIY